MIHINIIQTSWNFRFADFFLEIIVSKQSNLSRVSDSYKLESSANWFHRSSFSKARSVRKIFSYSRFMPALSILSHTRRLPTRLPTESSVHRKLENGDEAKYTQAKHNRGTRDAMRLAYAHIYRCRQRGKVLELHVG